MSSPIIPSPNELRPTRTLTGQLQEAAALINTAAKHEVIAIAGARLVTIRGVINADGELTFAFVRPDGVTKYTASNPAAVTVTSGAEFATTITANGESLLDVIYTPSEDGAVGFVDVHQL